MADNENKNWGRAALLAFGLCATIGAALAFAHSRLDDWLAARWTAELTSAPDAQAEQLLRQLAALDQKGIAGLTAGLASPRSAVVDQAQRVVFDSLANWELLSPDDAAQRLYLLAAHLADQTHRSSPQGRLVAAQVCRRILEWPGGYPGVAPGQVANACERVFAGVQPSDASQVQAHRLAERTDRLAAARERREAATERTQLARSAALLASHEHVVAPNSRHATPEDNEDEAEPRLLSAETATDGATHDAADLSPVKDALNLANAPPEPARLPADTSHAQPIGTHVEDSAPRSGRAASPLEPLPNLTSFGTVELVGLLYDDNGQVVARAEIELARRGFTGMHLELAKKLTDPDPEVRRRWTQTLPGMKDLDTRHWLLWLARDTDATVRRTAISLLATSDDPETLIALERLAGDDTDAGVRQIAAKISERRAGRKLR